jgi:hypothetical protein
MAQRKPKVTFGTCCTAKLQYAIVIYRTDNTIKFVTDVLHDPHKECRWEAGKEAYMFSDRKYAEDICFGLNVNGNGAFVMTIPDYFNKEFFKNPPETKKEGEEKSETKEAENA